MKPELYIIQCKSNLHAGSGDSSYGVIDKLIQRDVTDEIPCIYSSSLKGAFREYFEKVVERGANRKTLSEQIFGGGENKNSTNTETKGSHIFQQAFLLSLPLRSNQKPYYSATSPFMIQQLLEMAVLLGYEFPASLKEEFNKIKALNPEDNKPIIFGNSDSLEIEDFTVFGKNNSDFPTLRETMGENLVILSTNDMKRMTNDYHLPVIARNRLENGKSQNLWYEQLIPRESTFTSFVVSDNKDDEDDVFLTNISDKTVQIGGDSSVGYGFCKIHSIKKANHDTEKQH